MTRKAKASADNQTSAPKVKESTGYRVFTVCNNIILAIIAVFTFYPFLYLVAQSFSSEAAIYQGRVTIFPVEFTMATYQSVLSKGDFLKYYGNTIFYSILGTVVSVVFSAMLAYPLSKKELRLNKFFGPFIIFTMYFGGGMIPNYVLMNGLGLRNTVAAFILPGMIGTYYVLLMRSFFMGLPKELEEAAEIDGLTKYGVFVRIVMPLSKPIIATMTLFYMAGYWSNWFNAFLYLDNKERWPVAYYIRQIIMGATTTSEIGANDAGSAQIASNIRSTSMVLMVIPIICIYPFIQKYFVQGMMLGGVKE
ncbi:carbohydrate ABC transporter permease [Lachnospiraceae bacterium OttesenSCG-928-D06]|nr:carbohydrate ABC transporter permease [Lachnospiraceae bacterium OttesenSCG-928-D06]